MKALVSEYTVPPHESWDSLSPRDRRHGVVKIRRVTSDGSDKWGVYDDGGNRLLRRALAWRRAHPDDALVDTSDSRSPDDEPAERSDRVEIVDAFEHEPMPSWRSVAWNADHTFTLAEAMFVCGADIEQESGDGDGI
jgi:hypothetical protein